MLLAQVIFSGLFLLAIGKVLARYRSGQLTGARAALWLGFWLAALAVALQPNATATLARLAGIGRGADLVIYSALILIFFILFRLLLAVEKINRAITKLTRAEAFWNNEKR